MGLEDALNEVRARQGRDPVPSGQVIEGFGPDDPPAPAPPANIESVPEAVNPTPAMIRAGHVPTGPAPAPARGGYVTPGNEGLDIPEDWLDPDKDANDDDGPADAPSPLVDLGRRTAPQAPAPSSPAPQARLMSDEDAMRLHAMRMAQLLVIEDVAIFDGSPVTLTDDEKNDVKRIVLGAMQRVVNERLGQLPRKKRKRKK